MANEVLKCGEQALHLCLQVQHFGLGSLKLFVSAPLFQPESKIHRAGGPKVTQATFQPMRRELQFMRIRFGNGRTNRGNQLRILLEEDPDQFDQQVSATIDGLQSHIPVHFRSILWRPVVRPR